MIVAIQEIFFGEQKIVLTNQKALFWETEKALILSDLHASRLFRMIENQLVQSILPNIFAPLIVIASFNVASVILAEAALSFLGLGVPPQVPTWGSMLAESRDHIFARRWWLPFFPGMAILLTVLAFNIIGDWLRDYLDPRLKEVE